MLCGLAAMPLGAQNTNGVAKAPVISKQPEPETVDYGANASFKVNANGKSLSYQWRKDGQDLADYGNVAGAQGAMLRLAGVAQEDAGDYTVVISNGAGAVTSAPMTLAINALVVFGDDFEHGISEWNHFSTNGSLGVSTTKNQSPRGKKSAVVSHSGQKLYRNLEVEMGGRMRATFWFYDDGSVKSRCFAEVRGYTGKGYATYSFPGGLEQAYAIGCYRDDSGEGSSGSLKGEQLRATSYQGRVVTGKNAGWFNLDGPGAPGRSVGWHKFTIEREADGTTVHFLVDDVVCRTITEAAHVFMDCVTIGSLGKGTVDDQGWFDEVKIEYYPKKYDWRRKDSAGKGLFDWMRWRETGIDPVVTDITQIKTTVEVPGAAGVRVVGRWDADSAGIYAVDRRGAVEFVINVPESDAYRLEIEGREKEYKMPKVNLPLVISIDGESIDRLTLPYSATGNGVSHCFTPYLTAGAHTVRIYWDNVESHCSLYLKAVRLQALEAPDTNNNGLKDWVENRVLAQSGWDVAPGTSRVSPYCLEGRGQYLSLMKVVAGTAPVKVEAGPGHRWFANVPLSAGAGTAVKVSYQNGLLEEDAEVVWEPTNLLEASDTTIRKGDALLLTAAPAGATNGQARIVISGGSNYITNYITVAGTPVAHQFSQAGIYTVMGTYTPGEISGSITVKVVEAGFDGPIAAWANRKRYWGTTNLPIEAILESDPRLKFVEIEVSERQPGLTGRQFRITTDAAEDRTAVMRLGVNGPILASTVVHGFRLATPLDTYLRHSGSFEDGSQSIDGGFVLSPVLPQISVELQILVGGITYVDGTVTRTLTPADFDELGICQVRFVRAAGIKTSVCHSAKAYQNGVLVGWP